MAQRWQQKVTTTWPEVYRNIETGKEYKPHSEEERNFVFSDGPRYALLKGGEGAGKSVAGIIKDLERARRGMNGILTSPNLPHFKKSLWREFRLWCPKEVVIPEQRYKLSKSWQPHEPFELVFISGASLICGGMDNPGSWEGPNVHFAHLDEGRHTSAEALKVLDGRIRLTGKKGELPQVYITTTPKKNWLWEYFGPVQDNDRFLNFKNNSLVVTLPLELNRENLSEGYIENRRNSLTESEARVRVDAEWEDESDTEKFINIFWWDACQEQLHPLTKSEPAILSLDAATGSETSSNLSDCFAAVIVTRHPSDKTKVAVRYCGIWQAEPGKYLDFEPIENELVEITKRYSILELTYDATQLHDMAMRFRKGSSNRSAVNAKAFDQGKARLIADKDLQQLIMSRRIVHDGNPLLHQHMDNADIKKYGNDGIRIVKRASSLKVDAAVAISQGAARCLYFNLS